METFNTPHQPFEHKIRVRYQETDQMSVVHHSVYLVWYEEARTEYLRSMGLEYRALEEGGVRMAIMDAQCRYYRPARYDDVITIHTRISNLKRFKVEFTYDVYADRNLKERISSAKILLGSLNADFKPSPLPSLVFQKFKERLHGQPK